MLFDVVISNRKKMSKKNPLVFMDVSIDGDPADKMVFEVLPCFEPTFYVFKSDVTSVIKLKFFF